MNARLNNHSPSFATSGMTSEIELNLAFPNLFRGELAHHHDVSQPNGNFFNRLSAHLIFRLSLI